MSAPDSLTECPRTEKLNEAKKRGPHYECPNSTTPDFVTEHYFHVSITGTDFERFLLSQLSWWGFMYAHFLPRGPLLQFSDQVSDV